MNNQSPPLTPVRAPGFWEPVPCYRFCEPSQPSPRLGFAVSSLCRARPHLILNIGVFRNQPIFLGSGLFLPLGSFGATRIYEPTMTFQFLKLVHHLLSVGFSGLWAYEIYVVVSPAVQGLGCLAPIVHISLPFRMVMQQQTLSRDPVTRLWMKVYTSLYDIRTCVCIYARMGIYIYTDIHTYPHKKANIFWYIPMKTD